MAFTLDRISASQRLGISTRTLDRYVKASRIRTKRIGKKLFLEEEDVELIRTADIEDPADDYIVIHDDSSDDFQTSSDTALSIDSAQLDIVPEFARLYTRAQDLIREKDEKIEDLSYQLGQAKTKLDHSVDTTEYRRAAYILETTRTQRNTEVSTLQKRIGLLESSLKSRKKTTIFLSIVFLITLIALAILVGVFLF